MSTQARVCLPVLNLYAKPDETSEVISQALYGWKIALLEKHRSFQCIQTDDGYRGWVEAKGIASSPNLQERSKERSKVKLIYNAVPVYPVPHVKNQPLWTLPFEVELTVLSESSEEEGRWIQVELVEGRAGWIQRGHVRFDSPHLSLDQMLRLSRQFLGLPYIWGGTSSFGYDCSGFIQMLWRQRGIRLPRDARQQLQDAACIPIAWESLEPGDLLFYGSHETDISHVGLYLGDRICIHASVKPIPIVQETDLDDTCLNRRFSYRSARRFSLK